MILTEEMMESMATPLTPEAHINYLTNLACTSRTVLDGALGRLRGAGVADREAFEPFLKEIEYLMRTAPKEVLYAVTLLYEAFVDLSNERYDNDEAAKEIKAQIDKLMLMGLEE